MCWASVRTRWVLEHHLERLVLRAEDLDERILGASQQGRRPRVGRVDNVRLPLHRLNCGKLVAIAALDLIPQGIDFDGVVGSVKCVVDDFDDCRWRPR